MSKLAGDTKSYRAYLMTREHRIIRPIEIASTNDEDAREQAKRHAGCYSVELWEGARKIEYFPSKS